MKKLIGVMPLYDEQRESWWMLPGYMKMLEAENAAPVMLPLTADPEELDRFIELCGGFLLTGGQDVSPAVYHAEKKPWCGQCCEARDQMDIYVLKQAAELDKPVLGICRGMQLMNACFGGTLYQDLDTERKSDISHRMQPPYHLPAHRVTVRQGALLHEILRAEEIGVNSCHHQGADALAPGFEVMAVAEDGLVEGIYMPSRRFVAGVQWHPEFSYEADGNSRKLIKAFAAAVL